MREGGTGKRALRHSGPCVWERDSEIRLEHEKEDAFPVIEAPPGKEHVRDGASAASARGGSRNRTCGEKRQWHLGRHGLGPDRGEGGGGAVFWGWAFTERRVPPHAGRRHLARGAALLPVAESERGPIRRWQRKLGAAVHVLILADAQMETILFDVAVKQESTGSSVSHVRFSESRFESRVGR